MAGNKSNNKNNGTAGYILIVFVGTFFCACAITLLTQLALDNLSSVLLGFVLLLVVVLIGVIFDTIGTAVAVANPVVYNAKASRKIPGAKKSLALTQNASKVANICNDVIGDVCGTVSGGVGTALAVVVVKDGGFWALMASVVIAGCVAALTVAGKAIGKQLALTKADQIIFAVGQFMDLPAVIKGKRQYENTKKRK